MQAGTIPAFIFLTGLALGVRAAEKTEPVGLGRSRKPGSTSGSPGGPYPADHTVPATANGPEQPPAFNLGVGASSSSTRRKGVKPARRNGQGGSVQEPAAAPKPPQAAAHPPPAPEPTGHAPPSRQPAARDAQNASAPGPAATSRPFGQPPPSPGVGSQPGPAYNFFPGTHAFGANGNSWAPGGGRGTATSPAPSPGPGPGSSRTAAAYPIAGGPQSSGSSDDGWHPRERDYSTSESPQPPPRKAAQNPAPAAAQRPAPSLAQAQAQPAASSFFGQPAPLPPAAPFAWGSSLPIFGVGGGGPLFTPGSGSGGGSGPKRGAARKGSTSGQASPMPPGRAAVPMAGDAAGTFQMPGAAAGQEASSQRPVFVSPPKPDSVDVDELRRKLGRASLGTDADSRAAPAAEDAGAGFSAGTAAGGEGSGRTRVRAKRNSRNRTASASRPDAAPQSTATAAGSQPGAGGAGSPGQSTPSGRESSSGPAAVEDPLDDYLVDALSSAEAAARSGHHRAATSWYSAAIQRLEGILGWQPGPSAPLPPSEPHLAPLMLLLCDCLVARGKSAAADFGPWAGLRDIEACLAIEPKHEGARIAAASCYMRCGFFRRARKECHVESKGKHAARTNGQAAGASSPDPSPPSATFIHDAADLRRKLDQHTAQVDEALGCLAPSVDPAAAAGAARRLAALLNGDLKFASNVAALRVLLLLKTGSGAEAVMAAGSFSPGAEAPPDVRHHYLCWSAFLSAVACLGQADPDGAHGKLSLLRTILSGAAADAKPDKENGGGKSASPPGSASGAVGAAGAGSVPSDAYFDLGLPSPAWEALSASAELLAEHKRMGNKNFQGGDYGLAVERYTKAVGVCGGGSRALACVLHSNRAAAYNAMSPPQHLEALADCLRAKALDPSYLRNYNRLATILMAMGRWSEAKEAIERLKDYPKDYPDAAQKTAECDKRIALKSPPEYAKFLGLTAEEAAASTNDDVKRSVKKLALRFHPDKAAIGCGGRLVDIWPREDYASAPSRRTADAITALLGPGSDFEPRIQAAMTGLYQWIQAAAEVVGDRKKYVAHCKAKADADARAKARTQPSAYASGPYSRGGVYGGYGGFGTRYSNNPYGGTPWEEPFASFYGYGARSAGGASTSGRQAAPGAQGAAAGSAPGRGGASQAGPGAGAGAGRGSAYAGGSNGYAGGYGYYGSAWHHGNESEEEEEEEEEYEDEEEAEW